MRNLAVRLAGLTAGAALLAACSNDAPAAEADAGQAGVATAFEARAALAPEIEALPRLAGDSAPIQAINADLDKLDAMAREAGCGEGAGGYVRTISQPMTGPDFVSFWIAEEWACEGAAHPSFVQTPVTYDLSTGQRADWSRLLPGLKPAQGEAFEDAPTGYVYGYSSPELGAWWGRKVLATVSDREWIDQCRDLLEPAEPRNDTFRIWADAEHGAIAISPDFPHAMQACAETAYMTADDMRANGVDARLMTALAAAQAAGNWLPREAAE